MADHENLVAGDEQTNAGAGLVAGETYGRKVAALTAEIKLLNDGRPYRIKENGEIEIVERLEQRPTFRRGDAVFYEALSFSRFVKRFRNATTVIFADALTAGQDGKPAPRFTALLDYHPDGGEQGTAQWDLFRAHLPLRYTPNWKVWAEANNKPMSQGDFAQFLEDNLVDIAEPAGAKLVEIARTLEAATDVQWQSHIRADNGAHAFKFIETVNGSATSQKDGKVEIPQEIILLLQPFEGAKQYQIRARFRYRLIGGKVTMWFDLVRMQDVLTEAFSDERVKIEDEVNGGNAGAPTPVGSGFVTPIYNGPAPAAQTLKDA